MLSTDTTPGRNGASDSGRVAIGCNHPLACCHKTDGQALQSSAGIRGFRGAKMYRIAFIDRDGGQRYSSKRRLFRQSSSRNSSTSSAYLFSNFHFWPVTERNADKAQEVPQVGTG